jgi:2-C-methyl-D-erythritol 4-phosphate cytidylyltransferase
MTCAVLVTAAGVGKRMGTDLPKQYLDLCGLPVLVRTLLAFERHPLVDRIVLTVTPGDDQRCRDIVIFPFAWSKITGMVPGGASRQESVYNGLQTLEQTEIVAIHDGVRPLVSFDTITATINAARQSGAAVACVPIRETVKRQVDDHLQTVSRANLWLAHTPQAFRTSLILQAHRRALEEGFDGTDDSALVERLGHPVTIVPDWENNLKITTPEDIERARLLCRPQAV